VATTNNIALYRGEDRLIQFTMSPVEGITGWTIVCSVKQAFTDTAPLSSTSATVLNGPQGVFSVLFSSSMTTLDPGDYVYDVQRTDSGQVAVLSIGKLTILPEVRT